ncbi:MAG TPA: anthranilate phosphoribosyltransferase [Acidimicrobiales bacterium]|nr:anthranilate phosphoribosyltransferase [Acidimicrobiales bacterium]
MDLDQLGGWPGVLSRLFRGNDLQPDEAEAALTDVLLGNAAAAQIAAFVAALRTKGETAEEMTGLVRAMLAHAAPVVVADELRASMVDTCGTGGDRSHSINVSTIASFVVAGAGVPVCKHGNRAASSAAGSADVLEALGVTIDPGPEVVARCIERVGIGFCFAPRFHAALRHAAPTRRELGVPTVFNFLGPLANPARPRRQVVGVSDHRMADKVIAVLAANGAERAMVVFGHDGLDELSTSAPSTVLSHSDGEVTTFEVDPRALGIAPASIDDIKGGDAATNAAMALGVLAGESGPHRDIVVLNAAAGLIVGGACASMEEGLVLAGQVVDDGRARVALDGLVRESGAGVGERSRG